MTVVVLLWVILTVLILGVGAVVWLLLAIRRLGETDSATVRTIAAIIQGTDDTLRLTKGWAQLAKAHTESAEKAVQTAETAVQEVRAVVSGAVDAVPPSYQSLLRPPLPPAPPGDETPLV